jgi:hypothetical protein
LVAYNDGKHQKDASRSSRLPPLDHQPKPKNYDNRHRKFVFVEVGQKRHQPIQDRIADGMIKEKKYSFVN